VALILAFAPTSGAHFNPAVSFAAALDGTLPAVDACIYIAAQIAGGIGGAITAHIMFGLPSFHFRSMRVPVPRKPSVNSSPPLG
jgi:glycerol uptake facilitator-like aquaporin